MLRVARTTSIIWQLMFLMQERLQVIMSAQFAKQEAALKKRVAELELKAAVSGVA